MSQGTVQISYYFTAHVADVPYHPAERRSRAMDEATYFLRRHILSLHEDIRDCTFHASGLVCTLEVVASINRRWLDYAMTRELVYWAIEKGLYFPNRQSRDLILAGNYDFLQQAFVFSRNLISNDADDALVASAPVHLDEVTRRNNSVLMSRWVGNRAIVRSAPWIFSEGAPVTVMSVVRWAHREFGLFPGGEEAPLLTDTIERHVSVWG